MPGSAVDITYRKKAEEKLRESEEKYRLIVENSRDIIFMLNAEGEIIYVSPAMKEILDYNPTEVIGRHISSLIHPDDLPHVQEIIRLSITDGYKSEGTEYRIRHASGEWRWHITRGNVVLDSKGGFLYFIGLANDITERRQMEESIRTLSKFPSENPAPVLRIDRDGKLLYVNNSGLNQLPEWHLQKGQIVSSILKDIVIETLNSGLVRIIELEHGKQTYSFTVTPISDADYTNLYGIDITERKKMDEELKQTVDSLKNAVNVTIHAMVSAVEMRDPYTAGHQNRSADLARAIATEMGLPRDKIDGIRLAGSIHDIGKLSIPAEILSKPTRLTNTEFSLIKEHPQSGYEMLKDVKSPWPLAEIVLQHHERLDGSGYPRNLKGDEILIEARIMAVADVVEAIASHRPYRPALGIEAALDEIEKNKGIFYDDAVVDTCLKLFREKRYQLA